ncbi:hypothetical protein ACQB60_18385 [Actinomycetota bacterium Odt1-20B]
MRAAQETAGDHSTTPIYDALYAEYLRSFRALPGDRTGEEELGFTAFGTGPLGTGGYGAQQSHSLLYMQDPRHLGQHNQHGTHSQHGQHHHSTPAPGTWRPPARQHATGHFPAALPPGPRREH